MAVRFFYVDESYDGDRFVLSALSVRHDQWKACFDAIRAHRVALKASHGLPLKVEIHARDFVAGRGGLGGAKITKWQRSRVFLGMLQLVARLPSVRLFNVCLPVKGNRDVQFIAWDRLVNRIERTMLSFEDKDRTLRGEIVAALSNRIDSAKLETVRQTLDTHNPRALIISDEGHEHEITKMLRKMRAFNMIPSAYGQWPGGTRAKNIPANRILEDPVFRDSSRSYFLQLVDCVAFALLKQEVAPTPTIAKYGIDKMFATAVGSVCFLPASAAPLGIVRN